MEDVMNTELLQEIAYIVSTMSNDEIKGYLDEFADYLKPELRNHLLASLDDNESVTKFLDSIDDNSIYEQVNSENGDDKGVLILQYVSDILIAINKLSKREDVVMYLDKFFGYILPRLKNLALVSQLYDAGYETIIRFYLQPILKKITDEDIKQLIEDNESVLWEVDEVVLVSNYSSDEKKLDCLKKGIYLEEYDLLFLNSLDDKTPLKEYIKEVFDEYLDEQNEMYKMSAEGNYYDDFETKRQSYELSLEFMIEDLAPSIALVQDDDFVIECIQEYEEFGKFFWTMMLSLISDEDVKDKLLEKYYDDLEIAENRIYVTASFKEFDKLKKYCNLLQDDLDIISKGFIASHCENEEFCNYMLDEFYNEINDNYLPDDVRSNAIYQLINFIGYASVDKQEEFYNKVNLQLTDAEEQIVVERMANGNIKHNYVNKKVEQAKKGIYSYRLEFDSSIIN